MARQIRLTEDGDLGTAGTLVWVDDDHPDGDGPRLITLTEDGPLGAAGTQVWVDGEDPKPKKRTSAKAESE